ncbi:MAG TPA: peptide-methionine (S)-S-oxide reductase MsrA [Azospirillaceae bacterium]|nr:peptide-methionine (S)-S-oxide reductase MsrA [Azospirillaceae bacterium]
MSMRSLFAAALLLMAAGGAAHAAETRTAVFAGGCFWCVESDFDKVPGVVETVSGYTGGRTANPTYEEVSYKDTGHREAVRVTYDPARVSYAQLVEYFWRTIDPVDAGGQFCDRGHSYTTAIYAADPEQKRIAEESRRALDASGRLGKPVVTEIADAQPFYPAEAYHQDYKERNGLKYRYYRYGCGRDARLEALWGQDALKLPAAGS